MYNDDERSSMDSNINTEQSLMNTLSCQDLNGWQLSHGWYWDLYVRLLVLSHTYGWWYYITRLSSWTFAV